MTRREWAIAVALLAGTLGAAVFVATYVTDADSQREGIGLAVAFAGLGAAAVGWGFWVLPARQAVDELDAFASDTRARARAVDALKSGDREIGRSKALSGLLAGAVAVIGASLLVPLRSLGPRLGRYGSKWRRGSRLVREDGRAIALADLNVDSEITVFPQGAIGDALSQVALIRLPAGLGTGLQGYVAYSRVCTHAGCPVALYRAAQRQLFCPCHQSVFDAANGGRVLAGPADRPLPQLPIGVDGQGYLIADGDFPTRVGPSSW